MPTFNQGIRTVAGQNLFGLLNSGKTSIHYTKIVYSSLDLSGKTDDEIAQMTDVQPQELVIPNPSVLFKPKTATTDPETEIRAYGDNQHLNKGFYINTYALYACGDDGKEILLGVTLDDHPSWLPSYDGVRPQALTYNWDISNKNGTDNVHFTDAHDEYATYGDYQTFSEAVGSQLNSAVDHASSYAGNANYLSGSVSSNSSNINNLSSSVNSIHSDELEDGEFIGGLDSRIDTISSSNADNSSDITAMKGKLSDVANNTSVSTAISNVSNATNTLSSSVSSNSSNIGSLSNKVNSVANSDIPNLSNSVNSNSSNVSSLSNNMNNTFLANITTPMGSDAYGGATTANAIDCQDLSYMIYSPPDEISDVSPLPYGCYKSSDGFIFYSQPDEMSANDVIWLFVFPGRSLLIDFTKMIIYTLDNHFNQTKLFDASQNYVSNSELSNKLSNYLTSDSLNGYQTTSDADNKLSNYAQKKDLSNYATKSYVSNIKPYKELPWGSTVDMQTIPSGNYCCGGINIINGPSIPVRNNSGKVVNHLSINGASVQIFCWYPSDTDELFYQKIIDYTNDNIFLRTGSSPKQLNWYMIQGTPLV